MWEKEARSDAMLRVEYTQEGERKREKEKETSLLGRRRDASYVLLV